MKGRRIILDHLAGREAAALMVNGQLDDILIDDEDAPRIGAIYRAICDRPVKGQGGMFLRLPDGDTAFLRGAKGLRPGDPLLVQVTGRAEQGKALPVTSRLLFKSRYAIVTPGAPGINVSRQISDDDMRDTLTGLGHAAMDGSDHGLILRSNAVGAEVDEIAEDIEAMRDLCEAVLGDGQGTDPEALTEGDGPHILAWREWTAEDIETAPGGFVSNGVLDALAGLRQIDVALDGGSMTVEATRACIAVDVNTGRDTSPAAALKANLAAARALPRALRLRGLGGQVVVDFVSVSKAHRKQVEQSLRAAFKADPVETSLVGWTTMGLFELNRKRERARIAPLLKGL